MADSRTVDPQRARTPIFQRKRNTSSIEGRKRRLINSRNQSGEVEADAQPFAFAGAGEHFVA